MGRKFTCYACMKKTSLRDGWDENEVPCRHCGGALITDTDRARVGEQPEPTHTTETHQPAEPAGPAEIHQPAGATRRRTGGLAARIAQAEGGQGGEHADTSGPPLGRPAPEPAGGASGAGGAGGASGAGGAGGAGGASGAGGARVEGRAPSVEERASSRCLFCRGDPVETAERRAKHALDEADAALKRGWKDIRIRLAMSNAGFCYEHVTQYIRENRPAEVQPEGISGAIGQIFAQVFSAQNADRTKMLVGVGVVVLVLSCIVIKGPSYVFSDIEWVIGSRYFKAKDDAAGRNVPLFVFFGDADRPTTAFTTGGALRSGSLGALKDDFAWLKVNLNDRSHGDALVLIKASHLPRIEIWAPDGVTHLLSIPPEQLKEMDGDDIAKLIEPIAAKYRED